MVVKDTTAQKDRNVVLPRIIVSRIPTKHAILTKDTIPIKDMKNIIKQNSRKNKKSKKLQNLTHWLDDCCL